MHLAKIQYNSILQLLKYIHTNLTGLVYKSHFHKNEFYQDLEHFPDSVSREVDINEGKFRNANSHHQSSCSRISTIVDTV